MEPLYPRCEVFRGFLASLHVLSLDGGGQAVIAHLFRVNTLCCKGGPTTAALKYTGGPIICTYSRISRLGVRGAVTRFQSDLLHLALVLLDGAGRPSGPPVGLWLCFGRGVGCDT
jgi:hypothetical protein